MTNLSLAFVTLAMLFGCTAEQSPSARNLQYAKGLYYCLKMHAGEHEGKFPENLFQLDPATISGSDLTKLAYRDPSSGREYDWLYFPAPDDTVADSWILLAAPAFLPRKNGSRPQRIIVQADGTAIFTPEDDFQRRIKLQRAHPNPRQTTATTP